MLKLLLVGLLLANTAIADDELTGLAIQGFLNGITGQDVDQSMANIQRRQQDIKQQQYLDQLIQQKRLENMLLQQKYNEPMYKLGVPKTAPNRGINCTTIGYQTYCR